MDISEKIEWLSARPSSESEEIKADLLRLDGFRGRARLVIDSLAKMNDPQHKINHDFKAVGLLRELASGK